LENSGLLALRPLFGTISEVMIDRYDFGIVVMNSILSKESKNSDR
jgi:hypothetical protein